MYRSAIFVMAAAAVIAIVSNIMMPGFQVYSTVMKAVLAICPFIIGANLLGDRASFLFGAICGLCMLTISSALVLFLSWYNVGEDSGPFMLHLTMPFIVTSVLLVTGLLRERIAHGKSRI